MTIRCVRLAWLTTLLLEIVFSASTASAQLTPASPPIANLSDNRFTSATEDWTSPSLAHSTLKPSQPLVGYKNEYPGYTVELVQLQWRFGDPLDVYVMKPKGVNNPPVILYLYGYPAGTDRFKDLAYENFVTKDGFAAVGFVSALTGHRYHDRPMREWFISELQEALSASAHDVQMVLNYLELRGDLDMNRVGMFSQGSGASIGILASGVDPRIKVLDTIDPWGDWPTWMALSPFIPEEERPQYVKPDFLQRVEALDPVTWMPRVQAKRFRLQDAIFDVKTPPSAKEKLRAAVPTSGTLVIYRTPEDFNEMLSQKKDLTWVQQQLRALPEADTIKAEASQDNLSK